VDWVTVDRTWGKARSLSRTNDHSSDEAVRSNLSMTSWLIF
jgi:hypothetical protein